MKPAQMVITITAGIATMLLTGCMATVRVPTCPNAAEASFGKSPPDIHDVNRDMASEAIKRHVKLRTLSPFTIDVHGTKKNVTWFTSSQNYPLMACGFQPRGIIDPGSMYQDCVNNMPAWMDLVQGKTGQKPGDLTSVTSKYPAACMKNNLYQ